MNFQTDTEQVDGKIHSIKSKNRMRITSKGQITIPQELREKFGFLPQTEVEFVPDKHGLRLVRSKTRQTRGARLVGLMRGRGQGKLSTDQIMALTRGER